MAGYYDPNKDYSRELQRTDLTAAQRSQLETERQNKINDPNGKYKGIEPNMYGSNKTYSQAVKDNDTDTIRAAVKKASGGSSGGNPSGEKTAGSWHLCYH